LVTVAYPNWDMRSEKAQGLLSEASKAKALKKTKSLESTQAD
jgi:hypothetical protein